MEKVLELQNISHSYHSNEGETPALKDLSFTLNKGEFFCIVGPSGCGKSTLLSIITGLLKPEQGNVLLHGKNVGYMLQKDHLFEWRTVYRNVLLGLEIQHNLTINKKEKAYELLEKYGLKDFAHAKPSE